MRNEDGYRPKEKSSDMSMTLQNEKTQKTFILPSQALAPSGYDHHRKQ